LVVVSDMNDQEVESLVNELSSRRSEQQKTAAAEEISFLISFSF